MKRVALVLPAIALFLVIVAPASSLARKGKLTPGAGGPSTGSISINITFPPNQTQLESIASRLTRASRMLCDATDGAVQVNEFRLYRGGLGAERSDVIWYPANSAHRSMVTGGYPYGHPGKRLRTEHDVPFRTLGHEFGHLLLGLGDQYDEQRRFGNACGIGVSVEAEDWAAPNHSIMQAYQTLCAQNAGPGMVSYGRACDDDTDCPDGWVCDEFTDTASEFNTPLVFDRVRGDYFGFPGPRSGTTLHLDLWLNEYAPGEEWLPADGSVEFLNEFGEPSEVTFEAYRDVGVGHWSVRALLDGEQLEWQVGDDTVDELALEFGNATECGNSLGNLAWAVTDQLYFLVQIGGKPDADVDLILPGDLIMQANDAVIDVDTSDLCERRGNKSAPKVRLVGNSFRSPDGIGRGAYFGAVGEGAPTSEPIYQQLGDCQEPTRDSRWNQTTQRFETSEQYLRVHLHMPAHNITPGTAGYRILQGTHEDVGGSDWELMEYNLGYYWPSLDPRFEPIDLSWVTPVDHDDKPNSRSPVVDNRADCDYPITVDTSAIEAPTSVAIVIDRSGSMGDTWSIAGKEQTRIEWARKAVAGYVDDVSVIGSKVTVMEFAKDQDVLIWPSVLDPVAKPGFVTPAEVKESVEGLRPYGDTAVLDAIDGAFKTLHAGDNNAVLVITDGEDNSSTIAADTVLSDSKEFDIPVFITPIGNFDTSAIGSLSDETGGTLFSPIEADQLPAALFRMRTIQRDEQFALESESRLSHGDLDLERETSESILVEPGAERLVMLITPDSDSLATWELDWNLRGPGGEVIDAKDAAHVTLDPDGFYQHVAVPNPAPGTWTLELAAPKSETPKLEPEAQFVIARIEHEGPDCYASTSVVQATKVGQAIEITAEASWSGLIGAGVKFSATVRDPTGDLVGIVPMPQAEDGLGYGSFNNYTMDGRYQVQVHCQVTDAATYALGEGDGSNDYTRTLVPAAFNRITDTFFQVNAGLQPTGLPPDGDCDGDGVSNLRELEQGGGSSMDFDGDGRFDTCDPDSDNDDVGDRLEVDGDTDGDGQPDKHDRDADDDGEIDGSDHDPTDPTGHWRFAYGDFNGDGRRDQVHGDPEYSNGCGRILVQMHGDAEPQTWWRADEHVLGTALEEAHFGEAVAVGDFDGDGFDDVAIGAPDSASIERKARPGDLHILYGSPGGLTGDADQLLDSHFAGGPWHVYPGDRFATRLRAADINGDGFTDLVIGAPDTTVRRNVESEAAGLVYFIFGSAGGLQQRNRAMAGSAEEQDGSRFGSSLAVGDFNGDGFADTVIGSPDKHWLGQPDAGDVDVVTGSQLGVRNAYSVQFSLRTHIGEPGQPLERFGERAWVRDENGDGYDDLVVMVPGAGCPAGEKAFYRVLGSAAGLEASSSSSCQEYLEP